MGTDDLAYSATTFILPIAVTDTFPIAADNMVGATITDETLHLKIKGWDKSWALKKSPCS